MPLDACRYMPLLAGTCRYLLLHSCGVDGFPVHAFNQLLKDPRIGLHTAVERVDGAAVHPTNGAAAPTNGAAAPTNGAAAHATNGAAVHPTDGKAVHPYGKLAF